jgi:putative membrane protein
MKIKLLPMAGLVAALAVPALAQTSVPSMKTSAAEGEKATIGYFAQDSVGDVQLGQLALRKGQNARVRMLAQAMVRDHTRTGQDAMRVAQQIGDDDVQPKVPDDAQVALSHLARYSGTKFDQEWTSTMVDAHKTDISLAHDALEFARTPAVRTYLQNAIAVDTRHLRMAEAAQAAVGKGD